MIFGCDCNCLWQARCRMERSLTPLETGTSPSNSLLDGMRSLKAGRKELHRYACRESSCLQQWSDDWPSAISTAGIMQLYYNPFNLFPFFSCAADEPGTEGKNHLHSGHGLRSHRPPWGHPASRHSNIWRGTTQAGVISGAKCEG